MTLLTEHQFRGLRDLLYVLLAPPGVCPEAKWAARCVHMFGELLDDSHFVLLALHDIAEPRWYGPGQYHARCRALADPRHTPPGVIASPDDEHASTWWTCPDDAAQDQRIARMLPPRVSDKQATRNTLRDRTFDTMFITDSHRSPSGAADTVNRGAGLWWRDPARSLSMTLAFRPARVVRAARRDDVRTSHHTLRLLLDTLCAPFAAAGRLRCAATSRPANRVVVDTGRAMSEILATRYSLTPRELEVTLQLLKGWSNARVATTLGISENTARHHTERIIGKLGVHSRAEIAWRAVSTLAQPESGRADVTLDATAPADAALPER
ncbi:MAG: helix-turn-helix transcriptional regulator [Gemmatimonadota bacterium]